MGAVGIGFGKSFAVCVHIYRMKGLLQPRTEYKKWNVGP